MKTRILVVTWLVLSMACLWVTATPRLEVVSQWGGTARAVAAAGTLVYLGEGPRVVVIDATDPEHPVEIGRSAPLPNTVESIVVSNGFAYVAAYLYGLIVLSVEDPANPIVVGSLRPRDSAQAVAVVGDVAYVVDRYAGLAVMSVEDPTTPVRIGGIDTEGNAQAVAVDGELAYVADGAGGLRVFSVADPTAPVALGALDAMSGVTAVAVDGTHAYIVDGSWLRVISTRDPDRIEVVGAIELDNMRSLTVHGDLVYVARGWRGVTVVSIADRAAPVELTTVPLPGAEAPLCVDHRLYVARGSYGLGVLSLEDAEQPVVRGNFDTAVFASSLGVAEDMVYVANIREGLHLVSIRDLGQPTEVGFISLPSVACVDVAGRHAFVGSQRFLIVVDVLDPSAPVEIGRLELPGYPVRVSAVDGLVVLISPSHGLFVVSVEDPTRPAVVGTLAIEGYGYDLLVDDGLLFVAAEGLHVVSLEDPSRPEWLASLPTGPVTRSLARIGDVVFLGDGSRMRIISVEDPASPHELASVQLGLTPYFASVGEYLAVGLGWKGVELLHVSDPTQVRRIAGVDTARGPIAMTAWEHLVFVADGDGGLYVMRVVDPETP